MTHNINAKFTYRIKREQRKADAMYNQPVVQARPAFLGDNNGVISTYQGVALSENYVVVRDFDGNLSVAFNQIAPLLPNLGIVVGYDPLQSTRFQVLAIRDYLTTNPSAPLTDHHKLHEWPGGDTVAVHSEQILPGLLLANTGLIVTLYPCFFKKSTGARGYMVGGALDLTSYMPVTGAQAFTIVVSDAGALQVLSGGTQTSIGLLTIADFPTNTDATLHDLWGVRLFVGQSKIRQEAIYSDVFDFRAGGIQGGSGGTGGHVIEDEGTPLTSRTNLNFVGAGVTATDDAGNDATVITIPGGGGVASVTGDGVDNTDPANPVLTYPTPGDIGAAPAIRTISTTAPLAGGGDLSADRTLSIAAATENVAGSMSAADKTRLDNMPSAFLLMGG